MVRDGFDLTPEGNAKAPLWSSGRAVSPAEKRKYDKRKSACRGRAR